MKTSKKQKKFNRSEIHVTVSDFPGSGHGWAYELFLESLEVPKQVPFTVEYYPIDDGGPFQGPNVGKKRPPKFLKRR